LIPCQRDQLPKITHIVAITYLHVLKSFSTERIPVRMNTLQLFPTYIQDGIFVVEANWLTDSFTNAKKMDERIYIIEPTTLSPEMQSPTKKIKHETTSQSPASSQDTTLKDLNYIENELSPQKPSSFLPKFRGESFDVPRADIPQCYHKKPAILRKVVQFALFSVYLIVPRPKKEIIKTSFFTAVIKRIHKRDADFSCGLQKILPQSLKIRCLTSPCLVPLHPQNLPRNHGYIMAVTKTHKIQP
jgi:hypothetical protein